MDIASAHRAAAESRAGERSRGGCARQNGVERRATCAGNDRTGAQGRSGGGRLSPIWRWGIDVGYPASSCRKRCSYPTYPAYPPVFELSESDNRVFYLLLFYLGKLGKLGNRSNRQRIYRPTCSSSWEGWVGAPRVRVSSRWRARCQLPLIASMPRPPHAPAMPLI